jgi:hypothetical protein
MGINGKTMRTTMESNEKYKPRPTTSGCNARGQARRCAASLRAEPACWQDPTPLEKQSAPEAGSSGRANVTLNLLPCTARAENASRIRSIPAIQV